MGAGLEAWRAQDGTARLWARDASLWTGGDEARWLGWLDAPALALERAGELAAFGADVRLAGFSHALLLGMGGSALTAEVLRDTFGAIPEHPDLAVLDSTDPAQVRAAERRIDPVRTLFIVASKSGTTVEPALLAEHFLGLAERRSRFVAITDPGTPLERMAQERGFWQIFHGEPTVGGRYAALTCFGLVPAAAMGLDVATLVRRARQMAQTCGPDTPTADNPGVRLGALLGAAARAGRDKLTLVVSPAIRSFGAWLEQLVAESTGKQGGGIVPVDREPLMPPERYGDDRVFVYVRLGSGADVEQDDHVARLRAAGHAVATLTVSSTFDLGQEFVRWEVATAVAGSLLGMNPFDQPDVEASKAATRALVTAYERSGALPMDAPLRLSDAKARPRLRALFAALRPGDYLALLAWLPMLPEHELALERVRARILLARGVATSLGFGPRYLHSTGQAHKGGSNRGVFLVLTGDDTDDVPVPGQAYSFGIVKAAQARGDLAVLAERGRRVLRLHLGGDLAVELDRFDEAVSEALA